MFLEVEIDKEEKIVYVSNENGTGCEYGFETLDEIGGKIQEFINNYIK